MSLPEHDVYYRIYIGNGGHMLIVEIQGSDESHYDQSRFLSTERFPDRKAAATERNRIAALLSGRV